MFGFKKPEKKELTNKEHAEFEKGDVTALIIAALITIIPTVLVFLALFYFVIYMLFLR